MQNVFPSPKQATEIWTQCLRRLAVLFLSESQDSTMGLCGLFWRADLVSGLALLALWLEAEFDLSTQCNKLKPAEVRVHLCF